MDKYRLAKDSFKTYIYKDECDVVFSGYIKKDFGELIVELMNRNNNARHENKVYLNNT